MTNVIDTIAAATKRDDLPDFRPGDSSSTWSRAGGPPATGGVPHGAEHGWAEDRTSPFRG